MNAELALAEAQANQLTAYITLYQAMGGGWSDAAIQATAR